MTVFRPHWWGLSQQLIMEEGFARWLVFYFLTQKYIWGLGSLTMPGYRACYQWGRPRTSIRCLELAEYLTFYD